MHGLISTCNILMGVWHSVCVCALPELQAAKPAVLPICHNSIILHQLVPACQKWFSSGATAFTDVKHCLWSHGFPLSGYWTGYWKWGGVFTRLFQHLFGLRRRSRTLEGINHHSYPKKAKRIWRTMDQWLWHPFYANVWREWDVIGCWVNLKTNWTHKAKRGNDDASLVLLDTVTKQPDSAHPDKRILFMDFYSAFNTVTNHMLLHLLSDLQVQRSLILWIQDFLTDRPQHVFFF